MIVLSTAHPIKFDDQMGIPVEKPEAFIDLESKKISRIEIPNSLEAVLGYLK